MFLEISDLGSTIYNYQIEQITEGDETIVLQGIASAVEEVKSYITGPKWSDGRPKYNTEIVMGSIGPVRNALLVRMAVTIAKFYIIELCNVDVIYETAKERYDRAITWLKQFARSEVTLDLQETPSIDITAIGTDPFIYGSREKFNHE